ncbi:MAG: hypothetical protein WB710_05445 [Stellaceae bacterium]|jgi:hypothetical protein
MSPKTHEDKGEYEAAVAAFIQTKGVTRCPTACVVRTQAMVSKSDQEALQRRAAELEIRRIRRHGRDPLAAYHRGA